MCRYVIIYHKPPTSTSTSTSKKKEEWEEEELKKCKEATKFCDVFRAGESCGDGRVVEKVMREEEVSLLEVLFFLG